jgi:hypothetical protein
MVISSTIYNKSIAIYINKHCIYSDGQPRPVLSSVEIGYLFPILCELLHCNDSEVLSHTSSAFSHLSDFSLVHIMKIISSDWTDNNMQVIDKEKGLKRGVGIYKRLVELLGNESYDVVKPALLAIGNIICTEGKIESTALIIEVGVLPHLKKFVLSESKDIQKEACWTLSNIASGSTDQIQKVLALENVVETLGNSLHVVVHFFVQSNFVPSHLTLLSQINSLFRKIYYCGS